MKTHLRKHSTLALALIVKTTLLLFLALLPAIRSFATAQFPDELIYERKEYSLHTNPLEEYFAKNKSARPESGNMTTALWRGYAATFKIKEGWLFVKEVSGLCGREG